MKYPFKSDILTRIQQEKDRTLWCHYEPHVHSLQKAMTIDKEQTSDENVIWTNLNDSVAGCSDCMSRNEDGQATSVPNPYVIYTRL